MTKYYTYISWYINLPECTKIHSFYTDGVHDVKNLNTCVLVFVLSMWSDQSQFRAFSMVFNVWNGPGFIFEHCN